MKAYKGFNGDLTCRGFQYEDGKTYEHEGDVEVCSSGFHACESPLEVFGYYPPATSVYREVDLDGVSESRDADSKRAARKLTVSAKISLAGLAKAHIEYVSERLLEDAPKATVVGNTASNTGNRSAASVSGAESVAVVTGKDSKASGALGCWIVLTERDYGWNILDVKAVKVDGKKVKADTFYRLVGGKLEAAS